MAALGALVATIIGSAFPDMARDLAMGSRDLAWTLSAFFVAFALGQPVVGRVVQALGACATAVLARAIARDLPAGPALTRVPALVMIAMAAAPGFSPALGTV